MLNALQMWKIKVFSLTQYLNIAKLMNTKTSTFEIKFHVLF